jgi:hypothetical protein
VRAEVRRRYLQVSALNLSVPVSPRRNSTRLQLQPNETLGRFLYRWLLVRRLSGVLSLLSTPGRFDL